MLCDGNNFGDSELEFFQNVQITVIYLPYEKNLIQIIP